MDLTNLTIAIADAREAVSTADAAIVAMPHPAANRDIEATQTAIAALSTAVDCIASAFEQFGKDVANQFAAPAAAPAPAPSATDTAASISP